MAAPQPDAVCAMRSSISASNETFHMWAFPPGAALYRNQSCTPNAEIGRSHVWLPVTHMKVGPSKGLFFY